MTVRSTQYPDRELGRAAPLDELDRLVEIDLEAGGERDGVVAREAHAHELGSPPPLHAVELGLDDFVCRSIHPSVRSHFRKSAANGSPPPGGFHGTFGPCGLLNSGRAQQ